MIYRCRIYQVVPENVAVFTEFFLTRLLPVQLRHGARLVNRWITQEGDRIIVVWEYDDREHFDRVDAAVRADPEAIEAQVFRSENLPPFFYECDEFLMDSTVPPGSVQGSLLL